MSNPQFLSLVEKHRKEKKVYNTNVRIILKNGHVIYGKINRVRNHYLIIDGITYYKSHLQKIGTKFFEEV